MITVYQQPSYLQQKGIISGRPFDPLKAGGKILKLDYTKVKVTTNSTGISATQISS
ncbi:MAG TPA: hypothetical protein VK184_06810 [Nostocaceae cyanobacterium]|nr:hypothetical protein [Nostocaceae cyanobacterium]